MIQSYPLINLSNTIPSGSEPFHVKNPIPKLLDIDHYRGVCASSRLMVLSLVSMEGEKKSVIGLQRHPLINRFFPFIKG
jgi:hypothetical protein